MPRKEYDWATGGVPIIGDHSLAKHRILSEYVQRYIKILTASPRLDAFKITLVDGFAGGGIYTKQGTSEIHLGSPAILINAVATAEQAVNATRRKVLRVESEFVFVEKNPKIADTLDNVLRKHVLHPHADPQHRILVGEFESHLDEIIQQIKRRGRAHRAIFVLDQYGYKDVPLAMLQKIFLQLPNAEVFLTVAVGWIGAYLRSAAHATEVITRSLGFKADTSDDEIEEHLTGPQAKQKLRVVQQLLHRAFALQSGANFATPFFIVSKDSRRPYWFLHLANSDRATDVVKELHWEV